MDLKSAAPFLGIINAIWLVENGAADFESSCPWYCYFSDDVGHMKHMLLLIHSQQAVHVFMDCYYVSFRSCDESCWVILIRSEAMRLRMLEDHVTKHSLRSAPHAMCGVCTRILEGKWLPHSNTSLLYVPPAPSFSHNISTQLIYNSSWFSIIDEYSSVILDSTSLLYY